MLIRLSLSIKPPLSLWFFKHTNIKRPDLNRDPLHFLRPWWIKRHEKDSLKWRLEKFYCSGFIFWQVSKLNWREGESNGIIQRKCCVVACISSSKHITCFNHKFKCFDYHLWMSREKKKTKFKYKYRISIHMKMFWLCF